LTSILWIVEIIVGLGLLIFLHELGHFLMAKRHGVRVETFSLGFGPAIWKTRRGETEYRVSWIPLGGYVKMAGEGVGVGTGKPDELTSKSAWQRLQIFAAGAIMNLLIAFPICIIAFLIGKYEMSPEIGVPGVPETYAGIVPGDVIVEIDGVRVQSGDQYRIEMVRKPKGSAVPVKVLRDGKEIERIVIQSGSESHRNLPLMTRLPGVTAGSVLEKAGVRAGDEILAVEGRPVYTPQQLYEALRDLGGKEVRLLVRRPGPEQHRGEKFEVRLPLPSKSVRRFPPEMGLNEPVVGKLEKGWPAFGALQEDDVIVKIEGVDESVWRRLHGTHSPARRELLYETEREGRKVFGSHVRSFRDVMDLVEPSVGILLRFEVERKTERKSVEVRPTYGPSGRGMIGMPKKPTKILAHVPEGSVYAAQGLQSGDMLLSVDGVVGEISVDRLLAIEKEVVKVEVQRKDGTRVSLDLRPPTRADADFAAMGMADKKGDPTLAPALFVRKRSFGEAIG